MKSNEEHTPIKIIYSKFKSILIQTMDIFKVMKWGVEMTLPYFQLPCWTAVDVFKCSMGASFLHTNIIERWIEWYWNMSSTKTIEKVKMTLKSEEVKSCIVVFSLEIVALSRLAAKDRRGLAHYIKGCPTLFSVYSTIPVYLSLSHWMHCFKDHSLLFPSTPLLSTNKWNNDNISWGSQLVQQVRIQSF